MLLMNQILQHRLVDPADPAKEFALADVTSKPQSFLGSYQQHHQR